MSVYGTVQSIQEVVECSEEEVQIVLVVWWLVDGGLER